MKRENFEEVKKLIDQIVRHEELLGELQVASNVASERNVCIRFLRQEVFIPSRYDWLTTDYLNNIKSSVQAELKEMNERLLKL